MQTKKLIDPTDLQTALAWWMRYAAEADGLLLRFLKHAAQQHMMGISDENMHDRIDLTGSHLREDKHCLTRSPQLHSYGSQIISDRHEQE